MDLKNIQDKLNNEFRDSERKIVFWYDDNAERVQEVDSIICAGFSKPKGN